MKILFNAIFFLLTSYSLLAQQTGIVRGNIIEDRTGEPVIGANVYIQGTSNGTFTDIDGAFSLEVPEGKHTVVVSYVTYQTMSIENVEVKAGKVALVEDIRLQEDNVQLKEVVVTAEAVRNTESALMTLKKRSSAIMDGISSSKIRLIGDATAVEAAKRITGVSIDDGKYVYVRGLGDRYSKTTLNGVDIPGLDPDRNTLQMDIFPTNLISNIVVSKNFTAEMPADFTGGLLNVETKDFPDQKTIQVSASMSYNPSMHFNSNFLTYDGGKLDLLGFDDGTRALPERAARPNIPTPISGASKDQVNSFVRSFNPTLAAREQTSLMDFGLGISLGDQINLKPRKKDAATGITPKLGYTFSLSYKTDTKFYEDVTYGEYQRWVDPSRYDLRYATIQDGALGERNVLIGALGGLAYKTMNSKVRLTAMHLQNGESRAGRFHINNDGEAIGQSGYIAYSDNLEYNQRSLTNVMLQGTHTIKGGAWEVDWRVSPTLSSSQDPDVRKTAFTVAPARTYFSAGAGGNPTRIWRSLSEFNAVGRLDAAYKYQFRGEDARLKFGASHVYKMRDYEILFFDIQFFGNQNWPDPDPAKVLDPSNIFPNAPNNIYYQSGNNDPNPNAYTSNVQNSAFYVSHEFVPLERLKTIVGLRAENYVMRHTGRDQRYASGDVLNGRNLVNEKVLESLDLFPSVNLVYGVTESQNLRGAYTRTIARPSFKELSFAQILDPITNRIFNGTLFPYSDWNGKLSETRIDNLDFRWEHFLPLGQILSASIFLKRFQDPIELVRIPEQQTSTEFQPRNVGEGRVYGVEFEFSKNLDFISPSIQHFAINGNVTIVESAIQMTDAEYNSRKTFEREGETISKTRSMAGQAPYVVNMGLTYSNPDMGLDAGLFYNVKGQTLTIVGLGLVPDVYFQPFHSLNFSVSKRFGKDGRTSADLRVSNILGATVQSVFRSYQADDEVFSQVMPGRAVGIGISHRF